MPPGIGGGPLTDLILYGQVDHKTPREPIVDTLPGAITVKINSETGPDDPEMAATAELLCSGNGLAAYYVLRLKRFETGTPRTLALTPSDTSYTVTAKVGTEGATLPAGKATLIYGFSRQGLIDRIDFILTIATSPMALFRVKVTLNGPPRSPGNPG